MRLSTFTTFAFVAFAHATEAPIEGYSVADLEWNLETTDGLGPFSVNGTIEQIAALIEAEKPALARSFTSNEALESNLAKRKTNFLRSDTVCDNFEHTYGHLVTPQIKYLRGLTGKPTNGPGPGACGRVSCTEQSAIWWCNDNKIAKTLDGWGDIADGAQTVLNACSYASPESGGLQKNVGGQAFHAGGWNVIVRKDEKKC